MMVQVLMYVRSTTLVYLNSFNLMLHTCTFYTTYMYHRWNNARCTLRSVYLVYLWDTVTVNTVSIMTYDMTYSCTYMNVYSTCSTYMYLQIAFFDNSPRPLFFLPLPLRLPLPFLNSLRMS
jgi:hypothetical protein